MMTAQVTDDMLMAYADGELEAAEQARLSPLIDADPALRLRLRRFERTGRVLSGAFQAQERPIPAALLRQPSGTPRSRRERLVAALEAIRLPSMPQLAAGAAVLMLVFAAGRLSRDGGAPRDDFIAGNGVLTAGAALHQRLETTASVGGEADRATPRVLQSFRTADGQFCREYALGGSGGRGVACRRADGAWTIALHVEGGAAPSSGGVYAPAGGATQQVIDGFVHSIMDGDPLAAPEERAAIERQWR